MTTLIQIEKAVAELAPVDQRSLLTWLQGRLETTALNPPSAEETHNLWLGRLEQLRNSIGTGKTTTSTEEILDDIRSDRN
jgi:hypothetical protein